MPKLATQPVGNSELIMRGAHKKAFHSTDQVVENKELDQHNRKAVLGVLESTVGLVRRS